MELERMFRSDGTTEVSYRPQRVGMYTIDVKWNGLHVRGRYSSRFICVLFFEKTYSGSFH